MTTKGGSLVFVKINKYIYKMPAFKNKHRLTAILICDNLRDKQYNERITA